MASQHAVDIVHQCLDHSANCEERAAVAIDATAKATFMEAARCWYKLARCWSELLPQSGCKKAQILGFVDAPDRASAEAAAVKAFNLDDEQRSRLVVQERG